NCKYCDSTQIIKYGKVKTVQYYYCKACKHKFADVDTIPKMQHSTFKIANALNLHYEVLSLYEIRRNFIQQYNDYLSDVTSLKWIDRFSILAITEASKYKPKVGDIWIADETVLDINGKNTWFWDIIDSDSRYLIAS